MIMIKGAGRFTSKKAPMGRAILILV